jgi:DNA-binding transcriptional regulator YhcF (GntR family)
MTIKSIDPASPVPLYHQIAELIRQQIQDGRLAPGDALDPLREAARAWGVNLHTVRHAYTALVREGLLETRVPRGTRVAAGSRASQKAEPVDQDRFVTRMISEAREKYGLNAKALILAITSQTGCSIDERPIVYVVECSALQCETVARQLEARFDVDAREWSLERPEEPPAGTILATYFHYNDVRRRWPHRLRGVRFVTIAPEVSLVDRIPDHVQRILVCERDVTTAETVAADISVILAATGRPIEPVVSATPQSLIEETGDDTLIVLAPRAWAGLDDAFRTSRRALLANYLIVDEELNALGTEFGWPTKATGTGPGTSNDI